MAATTPCGERQTAALTVPIIVRYANRAGRVGDLDIRHVLNGLIDRYLYLAGFLDSVLPFAELRQRSWINDDSIAAGNVLDFSERIRASLPPRRP